MTLSTTQAAQIAAFLADTRATTVAVETYTGAGAYGPVYATSANVTACLMNKRRMVLNSEGREVVSELTIHAAPADAAKFTPESRVTIAAKTSTVILAAPKEYRGNVVDVEVACT